MVKRTSTTRRRQRRHGDLPAGLKFRDGRPRWEPSPARRKAGWRGQDLKDPSGRWLSKGEAIMAAEAIAAAVAAHAAGAAVPAQLLAIAPKGAQLRRKAGVLASNSIGALIDGFLADPTPRTVTLKAKTVSDYRIKLARLVGVLADAQKIDAGAVRSLDVAILLPPPPNTGKPFLLGEAYRTLRVAAGEHMAAGVMAAASAWLAWVVDRKNMLPFNPALRVPRATPDGRIVVFEWDELKAMVAAAEALGAASVADAIILAVDLSWSQQDVLALTRGQLNGEPLHVKHRRIKTGVAGNPPLLAIGRARVEAMLARQAAATVKPIDAGAAPLVVCEASGEAWKPDAFRKRFAEVRALAATICAGVAGKQFRDLRDTAVTYCYDAGLAVPEICSRTLHTPERAQAVIAKHYGAIGQGLTDVAGAKLEAHYEAKGYTFDQLPEIKAQ